LSHWLEEELAIKRDKPSTRDLMFALIRKETAMTTYLMQARRGVLFEEIEVEEVVAPRV
jgi:hypothetical protein